MTSLKPRRPLYAPPLLALPMLGLALTLSGCAPLQQALKVPTVKVADAQLTGLSVSYPAVAHVHLKLQIDNPNMLALHMSNIGGHFYLNGTDVGTVNLPNVALSAQSVTEQDALLDIPVSLNTAATWLRAAGGSETPYRIEGTFQADMGLLGMHQFGPFTLAQGSLRAPHLLP